MLLKSQTPILLNFNHLKKNLKKDFSGSPAARIAILGDTSTQLLVQALRGLGYEFQLDLQIFEADFDQIDIQVLNPSSELYQFKPEFIIVFFSLPKLSDKFGRLAADERLDFAGFHLNHLERLYNTISSRFSTNCVFFNIPEPEDAVYGSFSNKTQLSFLYQIRKINLGLMDLAINYSDLYILDLNLIQGQLSYPFLTENKIYVNTGLWISLKVLPEIAKKILDIILCKLGRFKKCLILDLDNTLWGGIIGDDGLENIQLGEFGIGKAFTEVQLWVKQLKERGIILAICSKNDETKAMEVFQKHPDMILRLDDIAVFVANWNNKVDNLIHIQHILNIGFDTMVFLDDSPFERNMVRQHLPDITVPELPEDPAGYMNFIRTLNLFETTSVNKEDEIRTRQYQEESKRATVRTQFEREDEYLQSLQMMATTEPFTDFNIPRIAQLSQRSNQFNLRTIRYSESDLRVMRSDPAYIPLSFSLHDKVGDYGLIGIIILHHQSDNELFIDTWIMSCRVLKRGMEEFMFNQIIKIANQRGAKFISGEYLPTEKNGIVKNLLKDMGFQQDGNQWILNTEETILKETSIETETIIE